MFGDNEFWDQFGSTSEGIGGAILSGVGGIADTAANVGKKVPGAGSAISGMQALYHANAAVYSGVNGNRDNAVGHGAQAVVNGVSAIPQVGAAVGVADGILAHAAGAARWANGKYDLGIPEEAMPMSVADGVSNLAIGATNLIFGQEDMTNNKGSRHGEVAAGISGMALGPLGAIDLVAGTNLCETVGTMGADFFGSTKQEGTVGGKDAKPNAAAQGGAAAHEYFKKAMQDGNDPRANPTPLVPKPGTPGGGGGTGPGGSASSSGTGPGSGGSPGRPIGPADGQMSPGSGGMQLPPNLRGPGGLIEPTVTPAGPADASGQLKPDAPMPHGVQPKLGPQGPMPYGVQPKGNGAPMSGPMPKMPWFLEPAGPSTW